MQVENGSNYVETPTNPRGFFPDTKTATACSVRVALRVRPLVGRELYESPNICVTCYPEQDQLVIGQNRAFTFDKVFDIPTRQQDVFDLCVKNLVLGCFQGFNATVLAYGQTGSGKTFTMGSGYTIGLKEEELGIIPRVIKLIFDEVEKRKHKAEFIIKCTFLEIYNEELNDLLDHGNITSNNQGAVIDRFMQKKEITIREEKNGNISVFGLREEKVNSYEELAACLDKGSNFRSTASTLMNNCSSRSHAIFTISIEQHIIDDLYQPNYGTGQQAPTQPVAEGAEEFMVAKFHFVDLAGSERAKRTGATGATLKEGISINKGLLALGNVISALTEESKKNAHVPYRDSKLTRILQDSLGGNSRTSMIACVSPAEINFEETLNTLKYASRARNIKNKPIVNRDPNSAQIAQLRQQVYELTRELLGARKLLLSNNIEFESNASIPTDMSILEQMPSGQISHQKEFMIGGAEIQRYEAEIKDLKSFLVTKDKKISQLQNQIDLQQEQTSQASIEFFSVQKERDVVRFQLEQIISILKKRQLFEDVMKEFHGIDSNSGMDVDEGKLDFVFGSSGPCILEEYQVKVEEQKKELNEKQTQLKTLQKENELLIQQAQQDLKNLEFKENEIERLKRSLNKMQKENATIKNEQRRGTTVRVPPQQNQPVAPVQSSVRKMSTINTERKPLMPTLKKQQHEKPGSKEWISSELDYNIKHFNELFIENLSQSLSTMLVLKKPNQQDENMKTPMNNRPDETAHPLNEIQEFNPGMNGQPEQSDSDSSDDDSDNENDSQPLEIEHLLPQGEKEQQEVIDQNEETKKQDDEIKSMLQQQELQIVSLEDNLKNKEALLTAIKDSHKMMSNNLLEAMKNEYHKKIQQFQSEMQQLEQERIESLKKADTAQQKSKLEEAYKKKLKELEDKLKEAKQKDREQTNMMRESNKQKLKIKALETEIEKMRTQKVTMVRKMKEESEKHRKWKAERVKELMVVKQLNQKKDREIQQLKRENKKKDLLAKRKQEELSVLMKKTRLEKQKQINASKDRMKKSNIDIQQIQQWIITNTEKMLKYKDLQSLMEQELYQKKQVEDQIAEEQNQYAQMSVRKEKLEFRKCQIEQNEEENSPEDDNQIYEIDEEINQIQYEMKAIQDNIETLEEKFDFIDEKVTSFSSELLHFSPDDVEQLRFDQVQSIEGARACLGAFFGILLDVNVYKRQLEAQVVQNEGTIESLGQQLEELRKIQQANEINFQKQLEQISKEYKEKEEVMVRLIMENGGTELDQLDPSRKDFLNQLLTNKDDTQAQPQQLQRRGTQGITTINEKKMEIQKNNKELYNQSKTALSKRVAELERKTKEDQKKIESMRHKYEQSNQEKEVIKKQLDTVKSKLKTHEIQEVKQSKQMVIDDTQQYNSNQQKSPRHMNQQQKMQTLQEMRKERKIKKLGSQTVGGGQNQQKAIIEPRVIADEPMEEDEEENPFHKDKVIHKAHSTMDSMVLQAQKINESGEPTTNVFTRLSQVGKGRATGGNSLNTSQNLTSSQLAGTAQPVEQQQIQQQLEDDGKWKCIFNKEVAHNGNICALTSVGNQLYSTSNKSLKIWDLEKMQVVSDITAHSGFIKCMSIWQDKNILLTASDKVIFLWDMISLTQVGQLKAHRDEIKAMTVSPDGNLMFSAGKGSQNAPGLLVWDLRKGSQPLDEREKNQDIFSLTTTPNFLFYGCRSHQVIPFNYKTFEQYQAFEPPHFDAVTSLSILDGVLVSGSRDKMLRCWDYQRMQHLQVDVAHNDWINTLETDYDHKELYSGSKDGIIKVWRMKNQKMKCMANLNGSLSGLSINTLSKIDKQFGRMFASGSSDKCLKIWKRKGQDLDQSSPEQFDNEMDDPFDKAIDRNQDFFQDDEGGMDMKFVNQVNKYEEVKNIPPQNEGKHHLIGRSNTTTGVNNQNYYMPIQQTSKLEQKRRQKRLMDNQRKYQKENDQNFQQL